MNRTLTVRTQLLLGFGSVMLIALFASGMTLWQLQKASKDIEAIVENRLQTVAYVGEVMANVARGMQHLDKAATEKTPEAALTEIKGLEEASRRNRELYDYIKRLSNSSETDTAIEALLLARADYLKSYGRATDMIKRGDMENARQAILNDVHHAREPFLARIDTLRKLQTDLARAQGHEAELETQRTRAMLIVSTLLTLLISTTVAWFMTRNIGRQLGGEPAYAREAMQRIASGDLMTAIKTSNTVHGSLLHSMTDMQGGLRQMVGDIAGSTASLKSASAGLDSSTRTLASSVDVQSQATTSVAAAIEEMTASIAHITDRARNAEKSSRESGVLSATGSEIVRQTVSEMQSIASMVQSAAARIEQLGEESHRISSIVNTIREIAEQTNLLALNAAIEAARAGEQGRGFAVVADEVRKLAERTTKSAGEIVDMVSTMQEGTRVAVDGMSQAVTSVNAGVTLASQAGDAIEKISTGSVTVVSAIGDIAVALQQQTAAANAVAVEVERIAQMSEESSATVTSAANTAEQLRLLAESLSTNVARFKV